MSGGCKASSVFKLLMKALLLEIKKCFVLSSSIVTVDCLYCSHIYLAIINYVVGGWIMWDYGGINLSLASIPAKWFWLDDETGKFQNVARREVEAKLENYNGFWNWVGIGYLRQNRSAPAWHVFLHGRSHLHPRHPGEGEDDDDDDDFDDGKK